jgi:hypothetical protein
MDKNDTTCAKVDNTRYYGCKKKCMPDGQFGELKHD